MKKPVVVPIPHLLHQVNFALLRLLSDEITVTYYLMFGVMVLEGAFQGALKVYYFIKIVVCKLKTNIIKYLKSLKKNNL